MKIYICVDKFPVNTIKIVVFVGFFWILVDYRSFSRKGASYSERMKSMKYPYRWKSIRREYILLINISRIDA